jgi:hypothetical protein
VSALRTRHPSLARRSLRRTWPLIAFFFSRAASSLFCSSRALVAVVFADFVLLVATSHEICVGIVSVSFFHCRAVVNGFPSLRLLAALSLSLNLRCAIFVLLSRAWQLWAGSQFIYIYIYRLVSGPSHSQPRVRPPLCLLRTHTARHLRRAPRQFASPSFQFQRQQNSEFRI